VGVYGMRACVNCSRDWPNDRYREGSDECFACRSKTIGVAFAGGKAAFHGETTKEAQTRIVSEAAANGVEAVPAWHKTYAGPASLGGMAKLGVSLGNTGNVSGSSAVSTPVNGKNAVAG
jgi:hypothetical protein